ncbi:GMC family oxidoreductase [Roseateles sp. BYS96W]|uniref:GMC family oxidoreductase n=1 Tax=Pelomonas nitida TaxID=3299027 RepID=A0ABW7GCN6_9BURK
MNKNEVWDVIVVGAGSSGCVVANRLAQIPHLKVLLLEAGASDWNPWLKLPIGYYRTMFDGRYSWRFKGEPEDGLDGRVIEHPRGKVLGGSSAINGLVYIRGAASDYDSWATLLGDSSWNYENVLPFFQASERNHDIRDEFHGSDGSLDVAFPRYKNEFLDAFISDAVALGIPFNADFNGRQLSGVGRFQLTAARGIRSSAARAFLRRKPSNLEVRVRQQVNRIILDNGRAVGVEVHGPNGNVSRINCRNEVVVCAGAINTPKLLQLSGIGAAGLLERIGVQVKVDNPEIGSNLQDHIQVRMSHETDEKHSLNALQRSWLRRLRAGTRYVWRRDGELTVGAGVVGLFAYSETGLPAPDLQMHVIPFSAAQPGRLHSVGGVTTSICGLRPYSRGSVEAVSSDSRHPPRLRFNYLSDARDYQPLREGLRLASKVLDGVNVSKLIKSRLFPAAIDLRDDVSLDSYIRSCATTIFHPAGTCAMGHNGRGAVDSRMRVHGVNGLRVADASIMPSIVSGNINSACMMIGERAAWEIAGSLSGAGATPNAHLAHPTMRDQ